MLKCNYNCEYCVAASGQSQISGTDVSQGMKRPVWSIKDGLSISQKAIEWATSLPYRVGIRFDVHGEPFLNDDVIQAFSWLTHQKNVAFVEIQTNASMLKKKFPGIINKVDITKLTLFCTFHHSQISPEKFIENVIFVRDLGVNVIVNALVFTDNISPVENLFNLCRKHEIRTSADIRYSGFTVPLTEDGIRARHFLNCDPLQVLLASGEDGSKVFRIIADSGPLGKEIRFLAAFLVGLYGMPGRQCSAGHDYIFVDNWGDVYRCFGYADKKQDKMGSVFDPRFVPQLREEAYAPCHYGETCHQKEEYGNLKILREHRDLRQKSLNCFCGADLKVEPQKLFTDRMAMIELARHSLKQDRTDLFFTNDKKDR